MNGNAGAGNAGAAAGGQAAAAAGNAAAGGGGAPVYGNVRSASLYVGDLAPSTTESQLFEAFSQVGCVGLYVGTDVGGVCESGGCVAVLDPTLDGRTTHTHTHTHAQRQQIGKIQSIRILRDAITRQSLGYAYVNYYDTMDAERAIDVLNFQPINGTLLRRVSCVCIGPGLGLLMKPDGGPLTPTSPPMAHASRPPLPRDVGAAGPLPAQDGRGQRGDQEPPPEHRQQDALRHLLRLRQHPLLQGLSVPAPSPSQDRGLSPLGHPHRTSHVSHRLPSPTPTLLLQVVTDENGNSRGFGFVHFDSEASAQGCIQDVNGKIIGGQEVRF